MLLPWRVGGSTVSDLNSRRFKFQNCRSRDERVTAQLTPIFEKLNRKLSSRFLSTIFGVENLAIKPKLQLLVIKALNKNRKQLNQQNINTQRNYKTGIAVFVAN